MDPTPWSLGIGRAQCGLAASKRTDVDTGDHRVDLDACAGSALKPDLVGKPWGPRVPGKHTKSLLENGDLPMKK